MSEDDYSFLIQYCLPYFIKFLYSEKPNNDFEVTTYVELIHLQLGPWFTDIFVEIFVRSVDQLIVIEIWKKQFDSACQS